MSLTPQQFELLKRRLREEQSSEEVGGEQRFEALQQTLPQRAEKILTTVFGGAKIGERIGKEIARGTFGEGVQRLVIGRDVPESQEKLVDEGPNSRQIAGDVLRTASIFTPVGRIASGVGRMAGMAGVTRGAQTLGSVAAGGTTGAAADVGLAASEGEAPQLGFGTALGAGIPAGLPIVSALARTVARGAGRVGAEIQGALTGTSAETIEQAFNAARTGGEELNQFTNALRGNVTPQKLAETFRENIGTVANRNQQVFRETLRELGNLRISTAPARESFLKELADTGIAVGDDGLLNFSGSKLRTVPNAQTKLQQAWDEIRRMPDTLTLSEIDTTRQAIKGIKSIAGDEPSANLANMLIDDAVRSVRRAGEQVDGYGQMLDNFAENAEFLEELQRGLSSGDRATIDQTYRRLATALKTNNERRMNLVRELDNATNGHILSTISGQQLSELMPRGIIRAFAASLAGFGAATGGLAVGSGYGLIPLIIASPKITGEVVRALGLGARRTDLILEGLSAVRETLIKAGAIAGSEQGKDK